MPERFLQDRVELLCGDCREQMATLADNSIDACVTDPPYSLTSIVKRFGNEGSAPAQFGTDGAYARASAGFMGQRWDTGEVAFDPAFWREVLRVLKPGGHVLAMGGDRTFHRLACAIEDAGFEIRGTVAWVYGSGFPKNLDVSKRMRECFSADVLRACDRCDWQIVQDFPNDCPTYHHCDGEQLQSEASIDLDVVPSPSDAREHNRVDLRADDPVGEQANIFCDEDNDRPAIVDFFHPVAPQSEDCRDRDSIPLGISSSTLPDEVTVAHRSPPRKLDRLHSDDGLVGASAQYVNLPQCSRCGKRGIPNGLGSALKPAMELICLARKPLSEKTVAANVLKWSVGAINIDKCRVETTEQWATSGETKGVASVNALGKDLNNSGRSGSHAQGRWPANIILDSSEEVVAAFPETASGADGGTATPRRIGVSTDIHGTRSEIAFGDSGSAARFFYSAKADGDDRLGSKHPTVKPLDLIQYLVRLITPPNGVVLDCFAGTGTTGEAAYREGMRAVLIEREEEYQEDIRRRMALVLSGPDERSRESMKEKQKSKPIDYGPLFGGIN